MNLILLSDKQITPQQLQTSTQQSIVVSLDARQSQHCIQVLKVSEGDTLTVGLLNGLMGKADCHKIDIKNTHVSLSLNPKHINQSPPQAVNLDIYLALPRPKMLRRILRTLAECGIKKITLFNSSKVEKSYWQTPLLQAPKLTQSLIEGLEQAKDTQLPEVHIKRLFRPFVEDELNPSKPASLSHQSIKKNRLFVAHPYQSDVTLNQLAEQIASDQLSDNWQLIIGPEGGFTPFEIDLLKQQNAQIVNAGDRIYRTETFIPWVLGALSA